MSSQPKISKPVLSEMRHSLNNEKHFSQIFLFVKRLFINKDFSLKDIAAFDKPKIFSIMFFRNGSMRALKLNQLYYIPFSTDAVTRNEGNIKVNLKEDFNCTLN